MIMGIKQVGGRMFSGRGNVPANVDAINQRGWILFHYVTQEYDCLLITINLLKVQSGPLYLSRVTPNEITSF